MTIAEQFNARTAEWLQRAKGETVQQVTRVNGDGSDWNGGTDEGFYANSGLIIHWLDGAGAKRTTEVEGDDFANLWQFVMDGPEPEHTDGDMGACPACGAPDERS